MIKPISLLVSFLIVFSTFANINFTVDHAIFQDNENNNYVEFYIAIDGNSIFYAEKENEMLQASLETTYLILKGEKVIAFEKFQLKSPDALFNDVSNGNMSDLLDLRRIAVPEGDYTFTVIVKDLVKNISSEVTSNLTKVEKTINQLSISSIQLADSFKANSTNGMFTKNGFDVIPNVKHTYNNTKNKLVVYLEVYNANKSLGENMDYILDIKVIDAATNEVADNLRTIKKMKANNVLPSINSFNIKNLKTGEYTITVEAKDKNNVTLANSSTVILRSNPINMNTVNIAGTFVDSMTNVPLLIEYIKSLQPISNENEMRWADNRLKSADLEFMQRFFYSFWAVRNNLNPQSEWAKYKEQVDIVNEKFGYGNVNGYNTERGRVYLQYGKPNTVQNVPFDRDTYPYEIWQYYKLKGMTDRKLIFYSPSMEMLGYQVLHSNIRGEVDNPNWEFELINKTSLYSPSIDNPSEQTIQREAKDLYDNPR